MHQKQIIVNNRLVAYSRVGRGKVIVLLHGWGDAKESFNLMQASLAASYDVVAIDLPGFGKSEPPADPWDLSKYGIFVNDFLVKIGVSKVMAIIGHSNGAAIAINGLAQNLIEADKLVLIGASGIREQTTPAFKRHGIKVAGALLNLGPKSLTLSVRRRLYDKLGSELYLVPGMEDTFRNIVAQDLRDEATNISQPCLLIYGQKDKATPPRHGQIYASLIKRSKLVIIDDCDHFVHQQQPEMVQELVKEFLHA